jgi:hypothetical protein
MDDSYDNIKRSTNAELKHIDTTIRNHKEPQADTNLVNGPHIKRRSSPPPLLQETQHTHRDLNRNPAHHPHANGGNAIRPNSVICFTA